MPAIRFVRFLSSRFSAGAMRAVAHVIVLMLCLGTVTPHAASDQREAFKPFKLKTLDGQERTLADVLGPKATLVVFFFPTCKYCNEAFPSVQQLYDRFTPQGLSMVWINAVPREERLIRAWREKYGYSVPILVGASNRALDKDYKVFMTPTHYLLDADGRIISTHAGFKPGDEKTLEDAIVRALADKQP